MSDLAIKVGGLSKRYRLSAQSPKYRTLRETLANSWRLLLPHLRTPKGDVLWALRGIDLEIRQGEVVGIIGRNGSGKSTLLKILSRVTDPTEGFAELDGRVGSLLEVGTGFHLELTGRENIYLNGAILGMKTAEIRSKLDDIIGFAEMEKFIDTPAKHYSTGMYMRLAFAVAAHLRHEILLVDEVLAVGDAAFQKRCLGKMGEVAREGHTVLVVSHNMGVITGLCRRAVWLEKGTINADGDAAQVVEGYLSTLMNSRFTYTNEQFGFTVNDVVVRDPSGNPTQTVRRGDDMTVEVAYTAEVPVPEPYVRLVIHGIHGPCFAANMLLDGQRPTIFEGKGTISCRFAAVPLMPQTYTVRLSIRAGDGRTSIIESEDAASFQVTAELPEYGFTSPTVYAMSSRSVSVMIPYEWTHPDGTVAPVAVVPSNRGQSQWAAEAPMV